MPAPSPALHLRAETPDDLPALSALLQDMALRAGDVAWDAGRRTLALVGNRFRHEDPRRPSRVRCGVTVAFATAARRRNWPTDPDTVLALLAITPDAADDEPDDSALLLSFAAGVSIRLAVECIDVTSDDLSAPFGAAAVPRHR
jgi:hypothetical protein